MCKSRQVYNQVDKRQAQDRQVSHQMCMRKSRRKRFRIPFYIHFRSCRLYFVKESKLVYIVPMYTPSWYTIQRQRLFNSFQNYWNSENCSHLIVEFIPIFASSVVNFFMTSPANEKFPVYILYVVHIMYRIYGKLQYKRIRLPAALKANPWRQRPNSWA